MRVGHRLVVTVCLSSAFFAASASAHDYDVVARGRCVYVENGVRVPIAGARVELRDQDFGAPTGTDVIGPLTLDVSLNKKCGEARSGADGRFEIRARCGDLGPRFLSWTKPDLYVRCALVGGYARVFEKSFPFTLYNAATNPRRDDASPLDVGDVIVPTAPAKTFVKTQYAAATLQNLIGLSLMPVWVQFPGGHEAVVLNTNETYFASYAGTVFMSIAAGAEDRGTTAHEYGHTLHFQSFLADWSSIRSLYNVLRAGWQAMQHASGKGHTFTTLSNPVMAYAEGFAEFIEGVVYGYTTGGLPRCDGWADVGDDEAQRISIEGNVACRLYRLFQKYGLRDIWTAQSRAKAVRYDHFFAEFQKLHPESATVAVPPPSYPVAVQNPPSLVRPVAPPKVLAATPAVVSVAKTPVALAPPQPIATQLSVRIGATPGVAQTLQRAEGAACRAVRTSIEGLSRWLPGVCASLAREPLRAQRCMSYLGQMARRASALGALCR